MKNELRNTDELNALVTHRGAVLRLRLVTHQKREEVQPLLFFGAVDRN